MWRTPVAPSTRLGINLTTAKALGLTVPSTTKELGITIPPSVLARADEVIE